MSATIERYKVINEGEYKGKQIEGVICLERFGIINDVYYRTEEDENGNCIFADSYLEICKKIDKMLEGEFNE